MSLRASSTSSRAVPDFHVHGVGPLGELDADPACGTLMGNRGRLTNANGDFVRDWKHEGWITCNPFGPPAPGDIGPPRMYTRLAFLDEATACAAGHRPCGKCRHAEMKAFHEHWLKLHPHDTTMPALDARLHDERTRPVKQTAVCADLPRGAMVRLEGRSWLVVEDGLYAWNDDGYSDLRACPPGPVDVLTPPSTVAAMLAGWKPTVHHSAGLG
ncbi:MAG TPA: hypothetical protein VD766_03125 [Solirubrobacterales bacterium]|nr:hypothetical protein [Solirubrobacterales bacterium]